MTLNELRRPSAGVLALAGAAVCAMIWGTTWYEVFPTYKWVNL